MAADAQNGQCVGSDTVASGGIRSDPGHRHGGASGTGEEYWPVSAHPGIEVLLGTQAGSIRMD